MGVLKVKYRLLLDFKCFHLVKWFLLLIIDCMGVSRQVTLSLLSIAVGSMNCHHPFVFLNNFLTNSFTTKGVTSPSVLILSVFRMSSNQMIFVLNN